MAYALKRVTTYGTAAGMNPTGTDILAKTGTTDGNEQLWLVASSTKVAGAYWVGNIDGHADMRRIRPTHGTTPALARTAVMREMMTAAVAKYGGDDFAPPTTSRVRGAAITVPDLSGRAPEEAREALQVLGLGYENGGVQAGDEPIGTVHATSPAAGASAYRGDTVTVYTSTGPDAPLPPPAPTSTDRPSH
jgi:membrane peptidoglycan carboxypeptidase